MLSRVPLTRTRTHTHAHTRTHCCRGRYVTAAKYLPPIVDYTVLGDVRAPVIVQMSMDGKLRRADGGVEEPIPPPNLTKTPALACTTSDVCRAPPRDRSYCYNGTCVPGGGIVFDGAAFLGFSKPFSEQQMGVLGGHLRVAASSVYEVTDDVGFEMMAIGPLALDNDTILVAIRKCVFYIHLLVHRLSPMSAFCLFDPVIQHTYVVGAPTTLIALLLARLLCTFFFFARYSPDAPVNAAYTYLSTSLDRRACSGTPSTAPYCSGSKCCTVAPEVFYEAVLEHHAEWHAVFAPGMELTIPCVESFSLKCLFVCHFA
jgi:hypothetical protein